MKSLAVPVIDNFYSAVLLDPQFTQNDIVHTTERIGPCIGLFMPVKMHKRMHMWAGRYPATPQPAALKSDDVDATDSSEESINLFLITPGELVLLGWAVKTKPI